MSAERDEILRLRDRVHALEGATAGVRLLADAIVELRQGQESLARDTHARIEEEAAGLHEEYAAMDRRVRSLENGMAAIGANLKLGLYLLGAVFSAVVGFGVSVLVSH